MILHRHSRIHAIVEIPSECVFQLLSGSMVSQSTSSHDVMIVCPLQCDDAWQAVNLLAIPPSLFSYLRTYT